jgi:hypothetical protein
VESRACNLRVSDPVEAEAEPMGGSIVFLGKGDGASESSAESSAYLCRRPLSSLPMLFMTWSGLVLGHSLRSSAGRGGCVTRRAARRVERVALDTRRAGAIGVVRAGAHAYLGPRPGSPGRRHDGDGVWFPLGEERCGRSVFGGRPRVRGGSGMSGAGRGASVTLWRWRAPGSVMRALAPPLRARAACGSSA